MPSVPTLYLPICFANVENWEPTGVEEPKLILTSSINSSPPSSSKSYASTMSLTPFCMIKIMENDYRHILLKVVFNIVIIIYTSQFIHSQLNLLVHNRSLGLEHYLPSLHQK